MENKLHVAAIQMVSSSNWEVNLAAAERLIREAAAAGAELAILPEFFIRIANSHDSEFLNLVEHLGEGKIQKQLSSIAKKNNIFLVAGTIPTRASSSTKCYNTCIVYDNYGNQICYYHKIHLFKFNKGEHQYDEEAKFERGNQVTTFTIENFTFGLSICYDLRFPEIFRQMAGVDCMILPAAFVYHTGEAHWEVLLRARAIENQCYIIASAQGGAHDNGRQTYGHSMIIDPWGKVNAVLDSGEGVVLGLIEKQVITEIRNQLPALEHRRL